MGVKSLEMSSQFGFRTSRSCWIDSQRKFQQRIASVFKVVIRQGLDPWQGFKDTDDCRFVESKKILTVKELWEKTDDTFLSSHFFYGA